MPRATNSFATKSRASAITLLTWSARVEWRVLDFARQLRVLALLGRFNLVPKRRPVSQMLGRAVRQHHLGLDDAGLVGEVVMPVEAVRQWSRDAER